MVRLEIHSPRCLPFTFHLQTKVLVLACEILDDSGLVKRDSVILLMINSLSNTQRTSKMCRINSMN